VPRRESIPRELRAHVYGRDRFRCRFCAVKLGWRSATIDHLVPLCRGGWDGEDNYATSCWTCNMAKGSRLLDELGWTLLEPGTRTCDLVVLGITPPVIGRRLRGKKRTATRQRHRLAA
jgi:5-methylcytosine-specific restriction endonuclease McrA